MSGEYAELANAVIIQASKDWQKAVRTLKKHPHYRTAKQMQSECECFFLSEWFMVLTDLDGSYLLGKLKKEENIP